MATIRNSFTDDIGTLRCEREGRATAVVLRATGIGYITATDLRTNATNAERWSAMATHCEASETLRPYARRIRHMLGTAAGIDTP